MTACLGRLACSFSENDLRDGSHLKTTIAAKDGSFSFDFEVKYSLLINTRANKFHS
jgi:hypothetical protein